MSPRILWMLSIVRKTSVAFRSAKVAFSHSFAERKATIKDRTMLSPCRSALLFPNMPRTHWACGSRDCYQSHDIQRICHSLVSVAVSFHFSVFPTALHPLKRRLVPPQRALNLVHGSSHIHWQPCAACFQVTHIQYDTEQNSEGSSP